MSFTLEPATPDLVRELLPYIPDWPLDADALPMVKPGWGFIARLDGHVVAGGGMDPLWPGVAQCWLVLVPGARTWCPRSLGRALRQGLAHLIQTHRLWRVEAHVHAELPVAVRLVQWLGFQRECTKRWWGPDGKDYHHYALLSERYAPWCQ